MRSWTRLAVGAILGMALVVGASGAARARVIHGHKTASGSIACTVVSGGMTFSPPLTLAGNSDHEVVMFRLKLRGCTPGDGSNVTTVVNKGFRVKMALPTVTTMDANSCATATPFNGTIPATSIARWTTYPHVLNRSVLGTTGESWITTGPNVQVELPGQGSATNAGTSFAGTDQGGTSTISLTLTLTSNQYAAVCGPAGTGKLARSAVLGGTVSLGASQFSGFSGSSTWVAGGDPLAPSDTDGQVLALTSAHTCSSSNGYVDCSYGGLTLPALDGLALSGVTALSYDFAVQTPAWSGGGGGSPRLVLALSDGGQVQLDPETSITTGVWVHMDAISGAVDNVNGTGESCGTFQLSWPAALACHPGATILDSFVVNDSGWAASSGFDVWVDDLTLDSTVYSSPPA